MTSRHVSTSDFYNTIRACLMQVLTINSIARNACMAGDWPIVEKVLNLDIDANAHDHIAYANRAFVMARKCHWNHALHDAVQVRYIALLTIANVDGDIVCQTSALLGRPYLQGHFPLRKKAGPGREDII